VTIAGTTELGQAVVKLSAGLAFEAIAGGIYRVAVGSVAVLTGDQAPRRVVAIGNDRAGTALAAETEPAEAVVAVVLLALGAAGAAQAEVIQLAKCRVATLEDQRLGLIGAAQATLGFTVQGIGFEGEFESQTRGAEAVQVAAAVGVPGEFRQITVGTVLPTLPPRETIKMPP
jgi:hypothetical protein